MSVVFRGDGLTIGVKLVDASKKIIWAEQYDRKIDLLATQRDRHHHCPKARTKNRQATKQKASPNATRTTTRINFT